MLFKALRTVLLFSVAAPLAMAQHLRPQNDQRELTFWPYSTKNICKTDLKCEIVDVDNNNSILKKLSYWCNYLTVKVGERERGYSVQCTTSQEIKRMTFFYDEGEDGRHDAYDSPYAMGGDSYGDDGGRWVNEVKLFQKPGYNTFKVTVKVDDDNSYSKFFSIKTKCPLGYYASRGECVKSKYSWCFW